MHPDEWGLREFLASQEARLRELIIIR